MKKRETERKTKRVLRKLAVAANACATLPDKVAMEEVPATIRDNRIYTYRQAVKLHQAIVVASNLHVNPSFAFAAVTNRKLIQPYVDALMEMQRFATPAALAYQKARDEAVTRHLTQLQRDTTKDKVRAVLDNPMAYVQELQGINAAMADGYAQWQEYERMVEKWLSSALPAPVTMATCKHTDLPVMPLHIIDDIYPMLVS